MTISKFFKIVVGKFLAFAIGIGLFSITHPILLKWFAGSARHVGKPIHATVYTDGQINNDIKVFHITKSWRGNEKASDYLLSLTEYDSLGMLKFFNINLNEGWIGRPVGASKNDYDFVMERLFQSERGAHFSSFEGEMKGFGFDPQLSFTDKQIKFNVPPNMLKFDSIRIKLK